MSVQVVLLWITKYPSQLLTVRIWIQLDWAKRCEIEESCTTNRCFWAGFWSYNTLSLDTATQEPACTCLHSPRGAVTLTLQRDVTPKLLCTHMQSLKEGFRDTNMNEPCKYQRPAPPSISHKYQFLPFLHCQDGTPATSAHRTHRSHTAEAAKVSSSSAAKLYGQRWSLSLAAATCLSLGRRCIFRWMSPVNKMWVFHAIAVAQIWGFGLHPLSQDWSVVKWVSGTWLQFRSKDRGSRGHHYAARGLPDFKVCHNKFFSSKYDTKLERKQ